MSRPRNNFRKTDLIRAVTAAREAGIKDPKFVIGLPNGSSITVVPGRPDETNEWDTALPDDPPAT